MWIKKHKAFPDAASVTLAGTLLTLYSRNTEITRLTAVFLTTIQYLLQS
jgi:lipid A disaccharide synthetase